MAVTAAPGDFRAETRLPSDYLPLLRWMIFTGVCVFGFVLAWHFGLIRMMLNSDKTYISVIILHPLRRGFDPLPGAHGDHLPRALQGDAHPGPGARRDA